MDVDPSGASGLRLVPGSAAAISKFTVPPGLWNQGPTHLLLISRPVSQLLDTTVLWGLVEPLSPVMGFWNP